GTIWPFPPVIQHGRLLPNRGEPPVLGPSVVSTYSAKPISPAASLPAAAYPPHLLGSPALATRAPAY
ncbi:MAG TPA: hypothetical protein VF394_09290, partial [Candidatus Acidoferrum sp.]